MLLALWGSLSLAALRRWWSERVVDRRDQHLRALLAGAVVPVQRSAPDLEPGLVTSLPTCLAQTSRVARVSRTQHP